MEYESSLTCSQDLFKINFNIILPSTARLFKWSLSPRYPDQNPLSTSLFPHMCHMRLPSHSSWFDLPNNIWWEVQIMKPLTVQNPSAPFSSLLGPNTFLCTLLSNILSLSNVYWTVHHCNSWRMKDQLNVTWYFISILMCSTCFGH